MLYYAKSAVNSYKLQYIVDQKLTDYRPASSNNYSHSIEFILFIGFRFLPCWNKLLATQL